MVDNFFYDILLKIVIIFIICIFVGATCFHIIFKADYRPGLNTMPFIWYQMIKSVVYHSRKKLASPSTYLIDTMWGMCHVMDKQKLFCFTTFSKTYVFLFKGETAEVVLSSNKFVDKSQDYDMTKEMFKDGLIMSRGTKWHTRRRLLTSTFHFKILQDFLPLIQEQSNKIVSDLLATSANEPWVDIYSLMKAYSWAMFLKTAVGVEIDTEGEEAKICHSAMTKYKELMTFRITLPWLFFDTLYKLSSLSKKARSCIETVHSYLSKVVTEKKKNALLSRQINTGNGVSNGYSNLKGNIAENEFDSTKKKRKTFMDLLLELHLEDGTFSEEDIIEECLSFFSGATIAMKNSLAYSLYCLGLYKDIQQKVHDEIDEIFKGSDRDITEEDLRALKYTECVIKETNRLYPLPFISRSATESFKIGDYTVPRGSVVVIFLKAIHRDPEVFPNPEKFDPTRFFMENSVGRNPYAFVPFSAGPRNCIAQKFASMIIKTTVVSILRKFDVSSMDERDKIHTTSNPNCRDQVRLLFSPRNRLANLTC